MPSNLPLKRASAWAVLPPIHAFPPLQPLLYANAHAKVDISASTSPLSDKQPPMTGFRGGPARARIYSILSAAEGRPPHWHLRACGGYPELKAAHGDFLKMRSLLLNVYGYAKDMTTVLLDAGVPNHMQATFSQRWSIWWGRAGGLRPVKNRTNSEEDGMDKCQCLLPFDGEETDRGQLQRLTMRPQELHHALVKPLPAGARLVTGLAAQCSCSLVAAWRYDGTGLGATDVARRFIFYILWQEILGCSQRCLPSWQNLWPHQSTADIHWALAAGRGNRYSGARDSVYVANICEFPVAMAPGVSELLGTGASNRAAGSISAHIHLSAFWRTDMRQRLAITVYRS
ncbi:hypothetical protein GGX14DRAFT_606010 [Mycena pura]|uniref:Uncharacterized protein n=1 Tax=Mycena pura TaxID=153505 RepID=A0AAD6UR98_9AGAR|nr:hypothetical protein GGX14DRAFT_606010 [Mycena pura]